MPKATPSKADLPKKPPKVREVKDKALMAQRVAEYDRRIAIYWEEMKEYEAGEKARENKKKAAKRGAGEAAAAEQGAERTPQRSKSSPSPSSKQPTPLPSPKQPKRNMHASHSQQLPDALPTARQLAAAVIPGFNPAREHAAFEHKDLDRCAKQTAWAEDVAQYAEQAGVLTAPLLYAQGDW